MMDSQDAPAQVARLPLSRARLVVPSPAVAAVSRPRVLRLLDEASRRPVALVTGGPGSGKTLAVADWTRRGRPPGPVAWISLTAAEADAGSLASMVVDAVEDLLGSQALATPIGHLADENDRLRHVFGALGRRGGVLVLDDVHLVENGSALGLLDAVLRHPIDGLHLVLICRHDPPLPLHRLRVAGELAEIRSADLAFTTTEAQSLFAEHGLALPAATVGQLVAKTGGWASGVRLACLTLASATDPLAAAASFDGESRYITEYVMNEVASLDEQWRDLLRATCVVDEVCAPLAEALTGNPRAGRGLQTLAAEDYFMVTRAQWYRPHNLVLQVLRAQLRAFDPRLDAELHRRAAIWFDEQGEGLEALHHAILARDWELAGMIVQQLVVPVLTAPDRGALRLQLAPIQTAVAGGRPELEVAMACLEYCQDDLAAASVWLRRAEQHLTLLPQPRRAAATFSVRVIQATIAHRRGDAASLVASATAAEQARTGTDAAEHWQNGSGLATGLLGVGELWSGRPDLARDLFDQVKAARDASVVGFGRAYWHGYLALAEGALGSVERSRRTAQAALDCQPPLQMASGGTGPAWQALAQSALRQGDVERVSEALTLGEQANTEPDPFVAAGLGLVAAERRLVLRDLSGARGILSGLTALAGDAMRAPFLAATSTAIGVRVELAAGLPAAAAALLASHDTDARMADPGISAPEPGALTIARARLLLAMSRPADVRKAVASLLTRRDAFGAEAWLLVGLAEDSLRHDAAATEALSAALDTAATEGFAQPFLKPGGRLVVMLRRHVEVVGTHRELVERAVETADRAPVEPAFSVAEPLTDRELSVLAYLPTLSSNSEIADAIGISVNTVKQHLKSINRKLGVGTRRDAVRAARHLDLLPRAGERQPS